MYTYRNALTTIYKYLNIDESIKTIDNTNKRGIIYNFENENEKIVIFVSPLSCKQGHKQDFIDTRDSGAEPRKIAWKYACENNLKFFHFAVKDDDRYNNYILSLESNEDAVSDISYRKHENNTGTGTQVNIPSWFNPSAFENGQKFSRISTPKGFYIAAIRIDYIYEYMRLFDNRPYSGTDIPNQNDSKIDLPTSPKLCAEYIINHIYDLDSLQSLKPVFKVNDTTLRVEAEILQNLGLPRKSLRFFFNLPNSASYTKSDNDGKVRVFDKVYDVPTEQGNYHAKLTTEWQDKPLEDDFDGNSLTALIKVVNEYYSHYLEIVKTENGYCLKIKNKTTKGIIPSTNILLYGVPGCGKSFYVEKNYESKVQEGFTIRVVFHPDYTYSDFVGQLMPVLKEVKNAQDVKEEKLQYDFVPGPFTRILQLAEIHKDQQCLLIIEELNRGNAPAIFGEIFQLLDRNDDGTSKYAIYNREISKELYDNEQQEKPNEPIKLPPNLTIVATMNTSNQNVFTMDTAFQRRWQMKHIPNRFTGESLDEKTINHVAKHLPNSEISWGAFAQIVNQKMHTANLGFGGTEDKSLGVYFATDNDLDDAERFAEKVLKYLWDDAFKLGRKELFNDCSQGLSAVIEAYEDAKGDPLKKVLVPEVYNEMQKKMAEMAAEQAQTAEEETSEEEAAESAAEDNPAQEPAGEE